jgi:hypothetical protein
MQRIRDAIRVEELRARLELRSEASGGPARPELRFPGLPALQRKPYAMLFWWDADVNRADHYGSRSESVIRHDASRV